MAPKGHFEINWPLVWTYLAPLEKEIFNPVFRSREKKTVNLKYYCQNGRNSKRNRSSARKRNKMRSNNWRPNSRKSKSTWQMQLQKRTKTKSPPQRRRNQVSLSKRGPLRSSISLIRLSSSKRRNSSKSGLNSERILACWIKKTIIKLRTTQCNLKELWQKPTKNCLRRKIWPKKN